MVLLPERIRPHARNLHCWIHGTGVGMCDFQLSSGKQCARGAVTGTNYCVLHSGLAVPAKDPVPANPYFQAEFDALVATGDGEWEGIVFPLNVEWPPLIGFPVNAKRCRFAATELISTIFVQAVDFSDSVFDGDLTARSVVFKGSANFDRCRFQGKAEFLNTQFERSGSFHRAEFSGRTIVRANFSGPSNFNEVVFRDSVNFSGWRSINVTLSSTLGGISTCVASGTAVGAPEPSIWMRAKATLGSAVGTVKKRVDDARRRLQSLIELGHSHIQTVRRRYARSDPNTQHIQVFAAEGQMQDVIFANPEQTLFTQVDLSRVYFRGTNLRGVRFLGVNWWQPALGRNGLHDEIFIRLSQDGPFRYLSLPILEETCRNVRVAHEESRSFNVASDFYIAEMEAVRARLPWIRRAFFSVPAMYRIVSNYGTSVGRAVLTLATLILAYVILTVALATPFDGGLTSTAIGDALLRAIRVLIFQTSDLDWRAVSGIQIGADSLLRILGLIQIAMVVLAFRSRIKRH